MKRFFNYLLVATSLLWLGSCQEDWREIDYTWPEYEDPNNQDPEDPERPVTGEKPRYVWIDAAANFEDYANSRENIIADCQRIKKMGFTDIIVDVRPTDGDVLFESSVASPLRKVDAWTDSGYRWVERTADFDYLQAFIEAGHDAGLKVNAAINTMVGGSLCPYGLGSQGMLFRDADKKSWATVINSEEGLINTMDITDDYGPRFLNPANDEVVEFLLQLLTDLASYEELDGIVLDRCRYDDYNLMSDFSEISREKFEEYIGQQVENWPNDVFAPGTTSLPGVATKHMFAWLEFRVKMIHDFIEKASNTVHSVNPDCRFGAYVGAWYSTYYNSGVNWASPNYKTYIYYPRWASVHYSDYGYADHLDFIFLGAYAGANSIYGSGEWSVEGFCKEGGKVLMGEVPYAAGPDIGNGSGWSEGGQADKIPSVIDVCLANSDGLFIFDLCHIKMYDYWDAFEQSINGYLESLTPSVEE